MINVVVSSNAGKITKVSFRGHARRGKVAVRICAGVATLAHLFRIAGFKGNIISGKADYEIPENGADIATVVVQQLIWLSEKSKGNLRVLEVINGQCG